MPNKSLVCLLFALIAVLSAQSNYEILFNRPDITGLTGGGATKLDGIPTTGLAVGTVLIIYDGVETRIYRLTAGTDAESSPTIIRPDDFVNPTNAKVWKARISSDPTEVGYSGDNLGNHTATQNIRLGGHYLSNDGDNEGVYVDATGRVGIGTATPQTLMHLSNGFLLRSFFMSRTANGLNQKNRFIGVDANGGMTFGTVTDDFLTAYNQVTFDNNGNVGIGTTTPAAKLDVSGNGKFTGTVSGADAVNASEFITKGQLAVLDSHYIGESYGGGTVFYVYDRGRHGLIAATADQSTGIQWYNGIDRRTQTTGDGVLAGEMNTALIIAIQSQVGDNQLGIFAAKICANYSVTADGVTYGDWYLPSENELNLLYLQRALVGGFTADVNYWSSTEYNHALAWYQSFAVGGNQFYDAKDVANYVRAIRSF